MFSCILEAPDGLSWGEGMAPLVPLKSAYGYVHGVANTGERTQRVTNWTARATIDMPSRKKTQKSTNSRVLNKLPETGHTNSIFLPLHYRTTYRPGGGETICPLPMAVRSKNRGGSTSVRGQVRSPHISGGRRWLSCRQPACL